MEAAATAAAEGMPYDAILLVVLQAAVSTAYCSVDTCSCQPFAGNCYVLQQFALCTPEIVFLLTVFQFGVCIALHYGQMHSAHHLAALLAAAAAARAARV